MNSKQYSILNGNFKHIKICLGQEIQLKMAHNINFC